jgi:hypothetical protein
MPFAFTAASSLFMVSCGPWLHLMVVNPCAAISALHRYPAAVAPEDNGAGLAATTSFL